VYLPTSLNSPTPATGYSNDRAIHNLSSTKQNSLLLNKAGQKISIHNLPGIIRDAFDLSFTQGNITAGFKETGVWPVDTTVFTDEDFESSALIDSPTTNNNLAV